MKNLYIDTEKFGAFYVGVEKWDSFMDDESAQEKFSDLILFKIKEMLSKALFNDHILLEAGDDIFVEIELGTDTFVFRCEMLKVLASFNGVDKNYEIFVDISVERFD